VGQYGRLPVFWRQLGFLSSSEAVVADELKNRDRPLEFDFAEAGTAGVLVRFWLRATD